MLFISGCDVSHSVDESAPCVRLLGMQERNERMVSIQALCVIHTKSAILIKATIFG